MKNTMTYATALNTAIDTMSKDYPEVAERLTALRDTLAKRGQRSENSKAKAAAKAKEATAAKRAELVAQVAPVLRKYLTADITAKDLFEVAKNELPKNFSAPKVQNVLIREMAPELIKTETKNKANTYRLAK